MLLLGTVIIILTWWFASEHLNLDEICGDPTLLLTVSLNVRFKSFPEPSSYSIRVCTKIYGVEISGLCCQAQS